MILKGKIRSHENKFWAKSQKRYNLIIVLLHLNFTKYIIIYTNAKERGLWIEVFDYNVVRK